MTVELTATGAVPQRAHLEHADARLWAARPRLTRLARSSGVLDAAVDDVVQEALLAAWRHLGDLHTPERFDAWLDSICRNACRSHLRRERAHTSRYISLGATVHGTSDTDGTDSDGAPWDMPDLLAVDPDEELSRQDLEHLLARALAYLSPASRELVEACYLSELSQREAAMRLSVPVSVLEARLHRARLQLRRIFTGELRAEAEAYTGALDGALPAGWRETREWCRFCGRQRMHGILEATSGGQLALRMRCPGCQREVNSGGVIPLSALRSFRPALKRTMRWIARYLAEGFANGHQTLTCPICHATRPARLASAEDPLARQFRWAGLTIVAVCPACNILVNNCVSGAAWSDPEMQRFMDEHPRTMCEPETLVEYVGQPAIRIRVGVLTETARLTLYAHQTTLQVLGRSRE